MRLAILFEDLDDKDEFMPNYCYWPAGKSEGGMDIICSERPDAERFHAAHQAANHIAMQGLSELLGAERLPHYNEVYLREMEKRGIKMRKTTTTPPFGYPTSAPEGGLW